LSPADLYLQLETAAILAALAAISLRFELLDRRGVMASIPIGYVILTFAGVGHFAILLAFFAISELATKIRVKLIGCEMVEKDWIRGWRNVTANGLIPMLLILLAGLTPELRNLLTYSGYLGALGAAFADTLATEIGLLYPGQPRLITNFRKVGRGTPGAISSYGYMGGVAAALLICALAYALGMGDQTLLPSVFLASMVGMTVDSLLGATIQAKYRCSHCWKITENRHHCGGEAEKIAGIRIIDTHAINLISTAIGALTAIMLTLKLT